MSLATSGAAQLRGEVVQVGVDHGREGRFVPYQGASWAAGGWWRV